MNFLETGNKEFCTGCTACVNACRHSAMVMKPDEEGFLYPSILLDRCVGCRMCIGSCPLSEKKNLSKNYQRLYGAWAKDLELLKQSSSGGIFSLLAKQILQQNGIVFGCAINYNLKQAEHIMIENEHDLFKFRGSKYMQSNLLSTFSQAKEILDKKRKVYYVGTPCQIAGLKAYLKRDYDNLLTSDLICHGVTSNLWFKKEIEYYQQKYKGTISNFRCRSKRKYDWTFGGVIAFDVIRKNKVIKQIDIPARYSPMYYCYAYADKPYILRPACYNCRFCSMSRVGDITIGDYWGIQSVHPEQMTTNRLKDGISLISLNSINGEKYFNEIKEEIEYFVTDKDKAAQQPALREGEIRRIPEKRAYIYEQLKIVNYEELADKVLFPYNFRHAYKIHKLIYPVRMILKRNKRLKNMIKPFLRFMRIWKRTIFDEIFVNKVVPNIPSRSLRKKALIILGAYIGKNVSLYSSVEIRNASGLKIEDNCSFGKKIVLDARSGLLIKKGAVLGSQVMIWTLQHDYNDINFKTKGAPVEIGEYSWVCSRVTILPGVKIGNYAVVASGAVVTRDVNDYEIVGGVPAKKIGERKKQQYSYDTKNDYFII